MEHKIIVALDFADADSALTLVQRLDPALCRLKVGKELFTVAGPELVRALVARGFEVFLDLKFHDIPNTVAAACKRSGRTWRVDAERPCRGRSPHDDRRRSAALPTWHQGPPGLRRKPPLLIGSDGADQHERGGL
jgi:hypothetical protein